jgi:hypothetical protein
VLWRVWDDLGVADSEARLSLNGESYRLKDRETSAASPRPPNNPSKGSVFTPSQRGPDSAAIDTGLPTIVRASQVSEQDRHSLRYAPYSTGAT